MSESASALAAGQQRRYVLAQVVGWTLMCGLFLPPHITAARMLGAPWWKALLHTAVWAGLGMGCSFALGALYKAVPERYLRGARSLLMVLGACLASGIAWSLLLRVFEMTTGIGPWLPAQVAERTIVWITIAVSRGTLMLGTWSALFLVVLLATRLQEEREKTMEASALMQTAQLRLLRSQLNPHFLFNALNSIIGLIGEDPKRAQQMVRDVASLLRRALDSSNRTRSTVGDEIELVELYLRCEKVRFEERLAIEVDVEEAVRRQPLAPMLVQPLVENAVKYGMRGAGTLELAVRGWSDAERVVIEVSNTGALDADKRSPRPGAGIGLRNVADRLVALYPSGGELSLFEDSGRVTARIAYVPEGWMEDAA